MKLDSRLPQFNWGAFVSGLRTMLVMYLLCYPIRYFVMLRAIEPGGGVGVTGTQMIEKASTAPLVIFVEILAFLPVFGFSTWALIKRQRTSDITTAVALFLFGLALSGTIRDIFEYPLIAAVEIPAAGLLAFLGYWLSLRQLPKGRWRGAENNSL